MNATKDQIQRLAMQLMPLHRGINILERRVEGASIDAGRMCDQAIHSLLEKYRMIEHEVSMLGCDETLTQAQEFSTVENDLKELLNQYEVVGQWVWIVTSD